MGNWFIGMSRATFLSALAWVMYLALEPFARRRWPHLMISWSRLLAGDWRDPLIGRDILIGALLGVAMTALGSLVIIVPGWFGLPPHKPRFFTPETLIGFIGFIHSGIVESAGFSLLTGLSSLFVLTLLAIAVRRNWLAAAIAWAVLTLIISLNATYVWIDVPFDGLVAAMYVFCVTRIGLVATFSAAAFSFWVSENPLTTDVASWYGGYTVVIVVCIAVIAFYAYKTATADKPLFRSEF
jgi:serine/threonine-protein kinase